MTETKPQVKKKSRSYSINDIYNWKFEDAMLPTQWIAHLGSLPKRFIMYADGEGGDGKSEYMIQLMKMLAMHLGKTRMIGAELAKHKQVTSSFIRNRMKEEVIPNRNVQYEVITEYEDLKARLKKPNSGHYIIIDSISFYPLNAKQIQDLIETFKKKSFIFVAYRAHFNKNKAIRHLCDIKVNVRNFIAYVEASRFGGTEPYAIWPERFPLVVKRPLEQTGDLFQQPVTQPEIGRAHV